MVFDHLDVYVSNLPDDFRNGGALTCVHNRSSAMYYVLWYDCVQPIEGSYVTIQSGVYRDASYLVGDVSSQLAVCDIEVLGEGAYDGTIVASVRLSLLTVECPLNSSSPDRASH